MSHNFIYCPSKCLSIHNFIMAVRSRAVVLLLLTFCLVLLLLWECVIVLCFVVRCFMSILVLQSSWWGRESWLLCLICLPGVSWWLALPWGCLRFVIVVFPDRTHLLFLPIKTNPMWVYRQTSNILILMTQVSTLMQRHRRCYCVLKMHSIYGCWSKWFSIDSILTGSSIYVLLQNCLKSNI